MIIVRNVILSLVILTNILFVEVESFKILGIFPFNGKSHNVMFSAMMKGLAKRGHQVDDITHFPVKNAPPNYKVVVNLNGTLNPMVNSFTFETTKLISRSVAEAVGGTYGNDICKLLALDDMQLFIKKLSADRPYDVVITEAFGANCFMGIGHLLKVPVVALSSAVEYPWISQFVGNYDNFAVTPNALLPDFDSSNFWDRLNNVISHYWNIHVFNTVTEQVQTEYMRKYINPNIPNIREVEKNVALTIVNRHPVIYGAKAVTSSLIEASGLHIEENDDELDQALKKWLDDSKHGVVYFTLGSLVVIETLPTNTLKEIFKSLNELAPMRVLMKTVDKSKLPPGLPKNVLTLPWIPQQAVLAHSNVRVFLTHGGLMGCQEALYYGVPMIGIPLFGDQGRNIAEFVAKSIAVKLNVDNITTVSLNEAFNTVLNNPQYRENTKRYSKMFKDRPLSAMDTATFWIEYIIRNGPEVLRSPGLEMPWWQIALIDVYGFLFLCSTSVLILIYVVINTLLYKYFYKYRSITTTKRKAKVQ